MARLPAFRRSSAEMMSEEVEENAQHGEVPEQESEEEEEGSVQESEEEEEGSVQESEEEQTDCNDYPTDTYWKILLGRQSEEIVSNKFAASVHDLLGRLDTIKNEDYTSRYALVLAFIAIGSELEGQLQANTEGAALVPADFTAEFGMKLRKAITADIQRKSDPSPPYSDSHSKSSSNPNISPDEDETLYDSPPTPVSLYGTRTPRKPAATADATKVQQEEEDKSTGDQSTRKQKHKAKPTSVEDDDEEEANPIEDDNTQRPARRSFRIANNGLEGQKDQNASFTQVPIEDSEVQSHLPSNTLSGQIKAAHTAAAKDNEKVTGKDQASTNPLKRLATEALEYIYKDDHDAKTVGGSDARGDEQETGEQQQQQEEEQDPQADESKAKEVVANSSSRKRTKRTATTEDETSNQANDVADSADTQEAQPVGNSHPHTSQLHGTVPIERQMGWKEQLHYNLESKQKIIIDITTDQDVRAHLRDRFKKESDQAQNSKSVVCAYDWLLTVFGHRSMNYIKQQWEVCAQNMEAADGHTVQSTNGDQIDYDKLHPRMKEAQYAINHIARGNKMDFQATILRSYGLVQLEKAKTAYLTDMMEVESSQEAMNIIRKDRQILGLASSAKAKLVSGVGKKVNAAVMKLFDDICVKSNISASIMAKTRRRQGKVLVSIVERLGAGALVFTCLPKFAANINDLQLETLLSILDVAKDMKWIKNVLKCFEDRVVNLIAQSHQLLKTDISEFQQIAWTDLNSVQTLDRRLQKISMTSQEIDMPDASDEDYDEDMEMQLDT